MGPLASVDPLSEVLSLLKLRGYMSGGFDAGGAWSIRFPRHDGIKFYVITSGQCWLDVEGLAEPIRMSAGDCCLLPRGEPLRLTTDLALAPVDAVEVFTRPLNGGVAVWNGGGDCFGFGGYFELAAAHSGLLLGFLPSVVHIRRDAEKAALRWCVEQLMAELREPAPGGFVIAQQLATLMLVQALRVHLKEGREGAAGWLFALADRQMAGAIAAMHADPARRWTLQSLAGHVGMSRTTFAVRFKQTVGSTPMEYLTRWRMLLAGERLETSSDPVSVIAPALGYESESAFSTAFRRVTGVSPRRYGRRRGAPAALNRPAPVPKSDRLTGPAPARLVTADKTG